MFACLFLLFTCLRFLSADSINGTLRDDAWLVERSAEVAESSYERTTNQSLDDSQEQIIDYEFPELKDEDADESAKVISHNDSTSDNSVKEAVTEPQSAYITLKRTEESGLGTEATQPTSASGYTDPYPGAKTPSLFINTTQQTRKLKPHELSSIVLNMTNSLLPKVFSQDWKDSDVPVLLKEISEGYSRLASKLVYEDRDPLYLFKASFQDNTTKLGCKDNSSRIWERLDTYITTARSAFEGFKKIEDDEARLRYARSIINSTDSEVRAMLNAVTRNAHGSCRKSEDYKRSSTFHCPCVCSLQAKTGKNDNSSHCHDMVFTVLGNISKKNLSNVFCAVTTSPQQVLHELHNQLATADTQAYAAVQVCLMVLHLFRIGDFSSESRLMQKSYEKTLREQEQILKETTEGLSKWFGKCIPKVRVNETFIEFTQVLQGYIVNEVNLNSKQSCRGNCEHYQATEEFGCYKKTFCNSRKRCDTGKLYSCTFFEADSTVCLSTSENWRYDWIKYKSGRLLGQNRTCYKGLTQVNSWWRLTSHCTYCLCQCDKHGPNSDRYISLKPVVSNIHLGSIVTGVRFIKEGRVVHIQIQEGKALPRGYVDKSTLEWQEVQPIVIVSSSDITTHNTNYATLSWYHRAIDLDHLEAPKDHVVTGLRFRRLGNHLNLEIQVTSIDFATAVMDPTSSIWIGNDNTVISELARKELLLFNPDNPLLPADFHQESGHNEYLRFQASSFETDVGQTTIPFIDAQAVAPEPPLWLSGIGLVYRGSPGNGGFISLKVATYD